MFLKPLFMRVKHSFLLSIVVMTIIIGFVGCSSDDLRIGWMDDVDLTKIAQISGTYRKPTGEHIVWQQYKDTFAALHALSSGQVDIVPVDMIAFASSVTVGVQARIIAVNYQYAKDSALIVRNQSQITNPQELVGKTIAVPFLTSAHYSLLRALEHWNISESDLNIVNLTPDQIRDAWQQGKIDGAYVHGYTLLSLQKNNSRELVNSEQVADWGYPTYMFWATMDTTIAEKPKVVQGFITAVLTGVKDYHKQISSIDAQTKQIKEVAELLKIPSPDVLTLLKDKIYLNQRAQYVLLTRNIDNSLSQASLFFRTQHLFTNVLYDYMLYVDPSWIDKSQVK